MVNQNRYQPLKVQGTGQVTKLLPPYKAHGIPYRQPGKVGVYRIYCRQSGELLYVGLSCDPRRRAREHHCGKYPRETVRYEVEMVPEVKGWMLERRLIMELKPRDNGRL